MVANEVWADVPGYEGLYKISDHGNLKSLSRIVKSRNNSTRQTKEIIIKPGLNKPGYYFCHLSKKGIKKEFAIHQLVAMAFLGHVRNGHKLIIDHIDNCKTNNHLSNLQIITNRHNSSKDKKNTLKCSSKFIGVYFNKANSKWKVGIRFKEKIIHIGYFDCEIKASEAYQTKLKQLDDDTTF